MAEDRGFLVPIVIDGTSDSESRVPEKFREVQWTRLRAGETPPEFVRRIEQLLSGEVRQSPPMAPRTAAAASGRPTRGAWLAVGVVVAAIAAYLLVEKPWIANPPSLTTFVPPAHSIAYTQTGTGTAQPPDANGASALPAHSIAVLPFVNLSGDPQQEYFSDGLSEELINALSQIDALAVASRTSSFAFKGKDVDIGSIGQKLHVAAVLEGSIRRSGNAVRITVQLINSANGFHMWSEDYDRDLKDILVLQTDIATAVAQQLRARLLGNEAAKIEAGGTHIPEAYDAYLLGSQFHWTLEGSRRASAAFRKATQIDPLYAKAYASLAISEANSAFSANYPKNLRGLEQARTAADKSLALAPQLVDGYVARILVRQYLLDFPGELTDAARALALSPNKSSTQNAYGVVLATFGRLPEAVAAMNKAIELNPLHEAAWVNLGEYLTAEHDFPSARSALNRAQALAPDDDAVHAAFGILDLLEGRHKEALAEFQKCSDDVSGQQGAALVGYSRGNERNAQLALQAVIDKHAADAAYQVAEVYAWRGEMDSAFQWLERAVHQHDDGLNFITYDPLLAGLRTDSRYGAILRKLKLSE